MIKHKGIAEHNFSNYAVLLFTQGDFTQSKSKICLLKRSWIYFINIIIVIANFLFLPFLKNQFYQWALFSAPNIDISYIHGFQWYKVSLKTTYSANTSINLFIRRSLIVHSFYQSFQNWSSPSYFADGPLIK